MQISISAFNQTIEKSHKWLKDLKDVGDFSSEEQAYCVLRSVLHSLRDRLIVDEAVHLASQVPMLIRGMYFEGWKPAATPHKERNKEAFLESISSHLKKTANNIDPEFAAQTVFQFLKQKISEGEIEDIKSELPAEILTLWD